MKEKQQFILTEKTSKLLIKFSIPAIVGMLVNAVYNLADSVFVANGAGTAEYNGVLISIPIISIIFAIGVGVSQGAASLVSIAIGQNDYKKVDKVIGNLYVLMIIASIVFFIAGVFFAEPIAYLFGARGDSLAPAAAYARIMMAGAFFVILGPAIGVILRAIGEFNQAMIVMVIGVIVNIILDPIFIYDWGLGMGAAGAAWASVIGFFVSVIYAMLVVFRKTPVLRPKLLQMKFDSTVARNIMLVGLPGVIRNITLSIATLIFNYFLIQYDPIYLSIFGTYTRIAFVIIMPSYGIVQGLMPIVGVNYGAREYKRVRDVSKFALIIVHCYLFVFAVIFSSIFAKQILGIFVGPGTSNPDLFVSEGLKAFRIMLPMLFFSAFVSVQSAITQSLGQKFIPTVISSLRVVLVVPVLFVFTYVFDLGVTAIWWSYPTADIFATIIAGTSFMVTMRRLKKLEV